MVGAFPKHPLELSYTSYKVSLSACLKKVMLEHSLAILIGGKNLARNFWVRSSHILMEFAGSEERHVLALFVTENGDRYNRIPSSDTLFYWKVSQTSMKSYK